ncbi:P-loop containing nucleoside triphosphate hydrolase protein [Gongronella butleri]|nr:P-loop containing nucleoside triphosphate hydrolase protein [Gongronella butleri]
MKLEVIGAGFGRTGTHSLYLALNKLGYNTHHMIEVIKNEDQDVNVWNHAQDHPNSPGTNWDSVYNGYDAAVDFPTCMFYKELLDKNPDAKVILTVRSAESWYKSICNTIFSFYMTDDPPTFSDDHIGDALKMARHCTFDGVLERDHRNIRNKELMCELFEKHNAEVIKTVPADRLLIMNLGEGWEPLCKFLGKPIPKEEYPKSNSTENFLGRKFLKDATEQR